MIASVRLCSGSRLKKFSDEFTKGLRTSCPLGKIQCRKTNSEDASYVTSIQSDDPKDPAGKKDRRLVFLILEGTAVFEVKGGEQRTVSAGHVMNLNGRSDLEVARRWFPPLSLRWAF